MAVKNSTMNCAKMAFGMFWLGLEIVVRQIIWLTS